MLIRAACGVIFITLYFSSCSRESSDPIVGPDSPCTETGEMVCSCDDGNEAVNYTMLYPNGGEVFEVDSAVTITFCSDRTDIAEVSAIVLSLSPDNGKSWYDIKSESMPLAPSKYRWVVPASILVDSGGEFSTVSLTGVACLIRVMTYDQYGDQSVDFDMSDSTFTIVE